MATGELRQQVDRVWNAFWTGGIANQPEVIERITYSKPGSSPRIAISVGILDTGIDVPTR